MSVGIFTRLQPTLLSRNQTQVCIGKGGRDFNFCVKFPDLTVLAQTHLLKKRHSAIRSNKTRLSCPFADSLTTLLGIRLHRAQREQGGVRVCRRGVHGIPIFPFSWNFIGEQRLPCTVPKTVPGPIGTGPYALKFHPPTLVFLESLCLTPPCSSLPCG